MPVKTAVDKKHVTTLICLHYLETPMQFLKQLWPLNQLRAVKTFKEKWFCHL